MVLSKKIEDLKKKIVLGYSHQYFFLFFPAFVVNVTKGISVSLFSVFITLNMLYRWNFIDKTEYETPNLWLLSWIYFNNLLTRKGKMKGKRQNFVIEKFHFHLTLLKAIEFILISHPEHSSFLHLQVWCTRFPGLVVMARVRRLQGPVMRSPHQSTLNSGRTKIDVLPKRQVSRNFSVYRCSHFIAHPMTGVHLKVCSKKQLWVILIWEIRE